MNWDERPQNLTDAELIAWALTTIADAVDSNIPDINVGLNLAKIADALMYTGCTENDLPGLQFIAQYVGGNLERIAKSMEKKTGARHERSR